jgi:hypothetical protein
MHLGAGLFGFPRLAVAILLWQKVLPSMPLSPETIRNIGENRFKRKREEGQLTNPSRGAVRFRTAGRIIVDTRLVVGRAALQGRVNATYLTPVILSDSEGP